MRASAPTFSSFSSPIAALSLTARIFFSSFSVIALCRLRPRRPLRRRPLGAPALDRKRRPAAPAPPSAAFFRLLLRLVLCRILPSPSTSAPSGPPPPPNIARLPPRSCTPARSARLRPLAAGLPAPPPAPAATAARLASCSSAAAPPVVEGAQRDESCSGGEAPRVRGASPHRRHLRNVASVGAAKRSAGCGRHCANDSSSIFSS